MKTAKRLLVTLLVLIFIVGTMNVGFATVNEQSPEVIRAQALGILRGDGTGNLNLDKPVTRAEAIALVVRILGLENSANLLKGKTKFKDVSVNHWATGYINIGVGQGIINGCGDGTFRPEGNVTYAEMAKMLLYAMNYGVTVEGTPWPSGVMGKADELGIFDGVNAVPNVPAVRGDVVKMIDNSLTIPLLKQVGYGDLKQYVESDKTLLSKLNVTELDDAKVVAISKVDSKLDDNEVKLEDKNGDTKTYVLKAGVTPEEIFGLTVDAWVNDNDEILFVNIATNSSDILYDTVSSANNSSVHLTVADDDYAWADDAVVYVNNQKVTNFSSIPKDAYGKVVLEDDEVVFANLFNFTTKAGIVSEVSGNKIYYKVGTSDRTLNLNNYDNVYAYDAQFKAIDTADIEKDNLIYYWVDGDNLYLVVGGKTVDGKLEKVKTSSVTIDGTSYDIASGATVSDNDDEDVTTFVSGSSLSEEAKNLAGDEVVAILDLNGDVRHIRGDVEATSDELYGLVTDAYRNGSKYVLNIFTKDGEEVALNVADKADWTPFSSYFENNTAAYIPVVYELNNDDEIDAIKVVAPNGSYGTSFEYLNGVIDADPGADASLDFNGDNDYIVFNGAKYFIDNNTVLMKFKDDGSEGIVSWSDIEGDDPDKGVAAYIVYTTGNIAKYVVFYNGFDQVEDTLYGVVVDDPEYNGDNWVANIDIAGSGINEYKVDNVTVKAGDVIKFTVDSDNEIAISTTATSGTVEDISGNYIKFQGDNNYYRLTSDTVVYNADDLDEKLSYSDIEEGDSVKYFVDDVNVKVVVID